MKILVTNDDGIDAPGIAALVRAASEHGQVVVVAAAIRDSQSRHGSHQLSLNVGWMGRRGLSRLN